MARKNLLISVLAFLIATLSLIFFNNFLYGEAGYVQSKWLTVFTKVFEVIFICGLVGVGITLLVWGFNFLSELAYRRDYSEFISNVGKAKEACIDVRNGQLTIGEAKRKYGVPDYMIYYALNLKLEEEIASQQEKIKRLEEKISEQKN